MRAKTIHSVMLSVVFFFKISFIGILTEMSNVSEISLPSDSIMRVSCFQHSRTSGRPVNVRSEKGALRKYTSFSKKSCHAVYIVKE